MPKPIDFTGFLNFLYINFLSARDNANAPIPLTDEKIYNHKIPSNHFKRYLFKLSGLVYGRIPILLPAP